MKENQLGLDDLTVLVNSSDGFSDCWQPFFLLWTRYASRLSSPIVLNTERLVYTHHPNLNIKSSRVALDLAPDVRLPWSDCLESALRQINTTYVLYLQEDYFLESNVKEDIILSLIEDMTLHNVDHVMLMSSSNVGVGEIWPHNSRLYFLKSDYEYRVSTQAGIWRRETLISILRSGESGWQFERNATLRSYESNHLFLIYPASTRGSLDNMVVPYRPTGIIKGKWKKNIVQPLFEKEGVDIDYLVRGFASEVGYYRIRVFVRRYLRMAVFFVAARSSIIRDVLNFIYRYR